MTIALNAKALKQNTGLLPSTRLSPFPSEGSPEVHGKQKEDKTALYLTALCHAQLLTAEEAVEVINTFKGGTLCSLLHH